MPRRFAWTAAALVCAALTVTAFAAPAAKKAPAKSIPNAPLRAQGVSWTRDGKTVTLRVVESSALRGMDGAAAKAFLKSAREAGAQVVLTEAFTYGSESSHGLLGEDGKINTAQYASLDALVGAARAERLGIFFTLANPEAQKRFAAWAGSRNPGVFFRDYRIQQEFLAAVQSLLSHKDPTAQKTMSSDPTVWGWVLCDRPMNAGGSPEGFRRWVSETASFLEGLAPGALVGLGLRASGEEGVEEVASAGAAGVDFVVLRQEAGALLAGAASWALQVGRPVVAAVSGVPTGTPVSGLAGLALNTDALPDAERPTALRNAFAAIPESSAAPTLFKVLTLTAGPTPSLKNGASARVSVEATQSAHWTLRWGQGGTMEGRLEGADGSRSDFSLSGLTANQELSVQVEARLPDGTTHLSERKSLRLPPVAPVTLSVPPESKNFITVREGRFFDGDKPWRYVGTNNYYLNHIDTATRDSILADARSEGLKVIRVWGFGEAHADPIQDWEKVRFFTLAPGKYDEGNLKRFDDLVASAGKHGIRLIIALANNWADYGGAPQWAAWFGYKDKDDFFDKPEVQKAFRDYVKMLTNRVNTVTGVAYKDDPTIFAWDLMNEPQYKRDESGKFLAKWVADTSAFLKKECGVRQLVTTGLEGHHASGGKHYSGTDFIASQNCPTIDFATYHIYPASEYCRWNLDTTKAVIERYVRDGHALLHKPVVMEEFGIPKTDPKYDKPLWVRAMMETFYGAGGDGVNYWMIVDPEYRYGDGNEYDRTMTETANAFSVTARELEGPK